MTVDELVTKIEAEDGLNTQVEEGAAFGRVLSQTLRKNGWKEYKTYSRCSKASFEDHLEKGGKVVDITSSFFMGQFTLISMHK